MGSALLFVALVLALNSVCCHASCGTIATSAVLGDALNQFPYCKPYVGPQAIFIPPTNFSQTFLQAMYGITRVLGHRAEKDIYAPRNCTDLIVEFYCSFLFRPCSPEGLPRPLCRSTCDAIQTSCGIYVQGVLISRNASNLQPIIFPSCSKIESGSLFEGSSAEIAGQPVFPDAVQTFNISGTAINVTCNAPAYVPIGNNFTCFGIGWQPTSDPAYPYCALACPVPVIRPRFYRENVRLLKAGGIMGLIFNGLVLITRSALPQFRTYPASLVLFLTGAIFLESAVYLWPFFHEGGHHGWLCSGGYLSRKTEAKLQGAFTVYSHVSHSAYWASIAIHTFAAVRFGNTYLSWKTHVATHAYCIGLPVLLFIVALADGRITGGSNYVPFGWFQSTSELHINPWREYMLFWTWLALHIVVTSICLSIVVFSIFKGGSNNAFSKWQQGFSILLYLFTLLFLEIWKWCYRIYIQSAADGWYNSIKSYLECSVLQPTCPRGSQPGISIEVFAAFVSLTPAAVGCLFLVNKEVFRHWKAALLQKENPYITTATTTRLASNTPSQSNQEQSVAWGSKEASMEG